MTIVSISEAARLTGKARSTIQAYIKAGKLSKTTGTTGSKGIDVSELLRVFGELVTTDATCSEPVVISQQTTPDTTAADLAAVKAENDSLKALLAAKQETIDSLNRALLLLEHKQEKTGEQPPEEPKKSLWKRLFS